MGVRLACESGLLGSKTITREMLLGLIRPTSGPDSMLCITPKPIWTLSAIET